MMKKAGRGIAVLLIILSLCVSLVACQDPATITYDANGGTGTMAMQEISEDMTLYTNAFTKAEHVFIGWSTTADGEVAYANDAAIKDMPTKDTVLYAQWQSVKVTVSFDANGGVGEMPSQTALAPGKTLTLNDNKFTKAGYSFIGWSSTANGGVEFADKAVVTFDTAKTIALFAVWKAVEVNYSIEYYFRENAASEYIKNVLYTTMSIAKCDSEISTIVKAFIGYNNDADKNVLKGKATADGKATLSLYYTKNDSRGLTFAQLGEEQKVNVSWANFQEDIGKVEITVKHGDDIVGVTSFENVGNWLDKDATVYAYYGKQTIIANVYNIDKTNFVTYTENVNVTAKAYNMAPLIATFPVSIFSLMISDADNANIDMTIPTFMFLERSSAYDWTKLPNNVYPLPTVSESDIHDGVATIQSMLASMTAWIKELYTINNTSKFNFYCVDNVVVLILNMLIANQIPVENWTATMISDGIGTANLINWTYNVPDPQAKYNAMKTDMDKAVADLYIGKPVDYRAMTEYGDGLERYAFLMANEFANVKWWTGRLRVGENILLTNDTTSVDNAFANSIKSTPRRKEFYLNNLLSALEPTEKQAFKELYHIDPNTFKEADSANKKVMMILGGSWKNDPGVPIVEADLESYIRMTVEVYGDGYEYYYKGHPGFATANYPGRQEIFANLKKDNINIHELDNTVAAEFFLFFFDKIEMVGYASTTFASVTDANAAGVFGQPTTYYPNMLEEYMNIVADNTAYAAAHAGITLTADVKYFSVDFTDPIEMAKHEIAIYNTTTKAMVYYKKNASDTYEVVAK